MEQTTTNTETPKGAASELNDGLCNELLDLLNKIFTAYENGPSCYDEPGASGVYIGQAMRIDDAEFHRIADILNKHSPVHNAGANGQPPEATE